MIDSKKKMIRKVLASPYRYCGFSQFKKISMGVKSEKKWYFVTKIVLTNCEKNCSSDREKHLKFEAEGRAFAKMVTE